MTNTTTFDEQAAPTAAAVLPPLTVPITLEQWIRDYANEVETVSIDVTPLLSAATPAQRRLMLDWAGSGPDPLVEAAKTHGLIAHSGPFGIYSDAGQEYLDAHGDLIDTAPVAEAEPLPLAENALGQRILALASMLTAATRTELMGELVEQQVADQPGWLHFADAVEPYLPELPDLPASVTVEPSVCFEHDDGMQVTWVGFGDDVELKVRELRFDGAEVTWKHGADLFSEEDQDAIREFAEAVHQRVDCMTYGVMSAVEHGSAEQIGRLALSRP